MNIFEIFQDLKSVSGTKDKIAYISRLDTNSKELLHKVLLAAMTPNQSYQTDMIPEYEPSAEDVQSLDWALDKIEQLKSSIEGNRDKYIVSILSQLSGDDALVMETVLRKKVNIGLKNKTLKKIWPDFPQEHPYNRCSSFNQKNISKLSFPLFSQTKEDGMYVDFKEGIFYTRSGNIVNVLPEEVVRNLQEITSGYVLQGEILHVDEEGNLLDRQTSNGISNRNDADVYSAQFVVFDCIPKGDFEAEECKIPYKDRWNILNVFADSFPKQVSLVACKEVNDIQEVVEDFKDKLNQGLEGSILKDFKAGWKNGTNPLFVKVKVECTVELLVTGFEYGDKGSKYENCIGALKVKSSDGKVCFSVGSGMTDEERQKNPDTYIGSIVEVCFNDIVSNKVDDVFALYLPRIKKIRTDKTEADSYEKIAESLNAVETIIENIFQKN